MNPEAIVLNEFRNFKAWLTLKKISDSYKTATIQYFNKYFRNYKLTTPKQLIAYLNKLEGSHRYIVLSLRSYLRFLGETDSYPEDYLAPFLKVLRLNSSKEGDNYVPSNEEVRNAFENIHDNRIKLYFEVLAFSGIRVTELHKLFSEFDRSRIINQKNFDRYPLNYIRGQKSIYYVYLPTETSEKLSRHYKINSKNMTKILTKSGLNPKYLRKWFYNFLIYNNVPESVCDFIEGRASQTIGSMHYLGKVKQADYWYNLNVEKLKEVFQ